MAVQQLSPRNGSQPPPLHCNHHHFYMHVRQKPSIRRDWSDMDAIDGSLTASAQPPLQSPMSHKPKPSPTSYRSLHFNSCSPKPPCRPVVIPAHRPVFYSTCNSQSPPPSTRDHDALAPGSCCAGQAVSPPPRATNHLPPGEGWARRLPACLVGVVGV